MTAVRSRAAREGKGGRPRARSALVAGLALALAGPAPADIVILKNGRRIQGRVVARGGRTTVLELPYGRITIPTRDVAEIRPERDDAYLADQAELLAHHGSFRDALKLYEEAIRRNPASLRLRARARAVRARYGARLLSVGRLQEARAAYEAILRDDPGHADAREGLARVEAMDRWGREAIARGRARAVQRDWKGAIDELAPVYERLPAHRGEVRRPLALAHAALGDAELRARRFGPALERYAKALAVDPDLVAALANRYVFARVQAAIPLLEAGAFERARAELADSLALLPDSGALAYYLALALEGLGRPTEAAELYARIAGAGRRPIDPTREIDALRRRAEEELAIRPRVEDARWKGSTESTPRTLPSPHFRIHYRNRFAAREVLRAAEASLARIARTFRPARPWPKPCEIHLHPDQASYREATGQPAWSGGATRVKRRLGVLLSHEIHLYQGSPQLLPAVIPHEVTHIVTAWALGYDMEPPLWANEGLSVAREPAYKRAHYDEVLRQAYREGRVLPLEALLAQEEYSEEGQELFYAQSYAVTRYLLDRAGLHAFLRFLRDFDPAAPGRALRRHFGIGSISELENCWHRRIEKIFARERPWTPSSPASQRPSPATGCCARASASWPASRAARTPSPSRGS